MMLPLEVMEMIFQYLNPCERCAAELVCRMWTNISRSSPHTWENALYIDGNNAPEPYRLSKRLDGVISRSNGKLHTLAIRVCGLTQSNADASRHMLLLLPTLQLKHLWIDCGTRWFCRSTDGRSWQFQNTFSGNMRKAANAAVLQCGALTTLRIATPQGTDCLKVMSGSLLANCRLDLLWLLSSSAEPFFADGSGFLVVQQIKSVKILSATPGWLAAGLRWSTAWRMLQACQATLEKAEIEIQSFSQSRRDNEIIEDGTNLPPEGLITFPRLRFLRLVCFCETDSRATENDFPFNLSSPSLTELRIDGSIPAACVVSLMKSSSGSLETLALAYSVSKLLDGPGRIMRFCLAFQGCRSLRKVAILRECDTFFKIVLTSGVRLDLSSLSVFYSEATSGEILFQFLLQSGFHELRKIDELFIQHTGTINDEVLSSLHRLSNKFEVVCIPSTSAFAVQGTGMDTLRYSLFSMREECCNSI